MGEFYPLLPGHRLVTARILRIEVPMNYKIRLTVFILGLVLASQMWGEMLLAQETKRITYGKYDIYYTDTGSVKQSAWVGFLQPFLNEAWRSAYTVLGSTKLSGQISIYFYDTNDGRGAWTQNGTQKIYMNHWAFVNPLKSNRAQWASYIAHETSHILFYNVTGSLQWNSYLTNNRTFLTESFAWYTQYVAYSASGSYNFSQTLVKGYLTNCRSKLPGYVMSWTYAGFMYVYGFNKTQWEAYHNLSVATFLSAGYFLSEGYKTSTNPKVLKLLTYLKLTAANMRPGLSNDTVRFYFEASFGGSYGKFANACWSQPVTTDSPIPVYKDTNYLYGVYYSQYYL
jgi:hypothetical protein